MSMVEQTLAGRYRLVERIALGGMGAVWRATDEVLNRPVAVKLLHENLADDPAASARFKREALTAASISHPNMANVYDYIDEAGIPGIVMELVEGETLAQRLAREGALAQGEATRIACGILRALEAAHTAGIVHRDIKPGNVLLTPDGGVKVADFGIAHSLGDASLTQTGMVLGTAHYSAPEQLRGKQGDPRTDQYAAGIVLYEMLTGQRPFTGDTPAAVAMARLSDDPKPLRVFRSSLPAPLEAIVLRALARDPAGRFPDVAAMRAALESSGDTTDLMPVASPSEADTVALVAAAPEHEEPARPMLPAHARRRLAPWLIPLAAVALLAVLGAFLFLGGPAVARVPSLTGTTLARATVLAKQAGLRITTDYRHSGAPKNAVLSQSIARGKTVPAGSSVTLGVSDGIPPCCKVPDLSGMSESEARDAITAARLKVGDIRTTYSTDGDTGVVSQSPSAGDRIEPGSPVDFTMVKRFEVQRKRGKHGHDD